LLYGHTPTPDAEWVNNTMCLDTGCVFGGKLTALRYPEKDLVSVTARKVWYEPSKPFPSIADAASVRAPEELSLDDVLGKRVVETRLAGRVTVKEENAAAALEVMSRFALEPRWLLYLPPTMAPCATSPSGDLLEHPTSAFDFYREGGVAQVVCEEKHMGSRAVVLVCRDEDVARTRFGSTDGTSGAVCTRTGRSFFEPGLTAVFLERLRAAVSAAGLWEELDSDWLLLDGELLPWSAKAEDLLKHQYAAVGAAARSATPAVVALLQQASSRGVEVNDLLGRAEARASNALAFTESYRRYVWPVTGLEGVEFAPFQVLASEARTWTDRDHLWHLDIADRLAATDPALVRTTKRMVVDTTDVASTAAGVEWWTSLTASGGEGMVVKPLANLVRGVKGWTQPGIKVRGREYLRIIYGPDYTEPANLERLRQRGLGHKRSLAAREYALGIESLERAARGEPLWRVHEPVFAVLALESEPVDPRL
jgi:protein phosphatase